MAPNLLVAVLNCIPSKRWFSGRPTSEEAGSSRPTARSTDHGHKRTHGEPGDNPVPGVYKRVRGQVDTWLLVATRDPFDGTKTKLAEPRKVVYSKLMHRWMFADESDARTIWAKLPPVLVTTRTSSGTSTVVKPQTSAEQRPVAFFQLDDGVTWVNHLDADGQFIICGGHARYCLVDREKRVLRPMLKGDDPVWVQSRRTTPRSGLSRSSSSYKTNGTTTTWKDDGTSSTRQSGEVVDPKKVRGDLVDAKKLRSELQKLETVGTVDEDRHGEEAANITGR